VGSSESAGYCSFTKAIEHLGDRWNLFILRQISTFGPQGFNDLATGLPGASRGRCSPIGCASSKPSVWWRMPTAGHTG
jgi:DNA-binding HxlR family transcriptional regulator